MCLFETNRNFFVKETLREKCPYSELFWSAFSGIRTEYGEILGISPYSFRMWENVDQNSSKYGHFLRSKSCSVFRKNIYWKKELASKQNLLYLIVSLKTNVWEMNVIFVLKLVKVTLHVNVCTQSTIITHS